MNLKTITDLYRHMEWADAAVWAAVLASENGTVDAKLRQYLNHLHLVQHAFLRSWRGELREAPYPTFDDARSLMSWGRSYYTEVFLHLTTLSDQQLSQLMPAPWLEMVEHKLGHAPRPTTVADTLLQVALHSTYHRGQINARLREAGGEPPLVDYLIWVWFGKPAPTWPPDMPNQS
jgi:uncharacterized damage-inducible protein DinB